MPKSLNYMQASNLLDEILQQTLFTYTFHTHTCFNLTVPAYWEIEERELSEFHILYVKSGCVTYVVEGNPLKLTAGHILFLTDGVTHSAYQDYTEALAIIPVRFTLVRHHYNDHFYKTEVPRYFTLDPRDTQKLRLLFENIYRVYCLPASIKKDALCHAAITTALAELSFELENKELNNSNHHIILGIKQIIDSNPALRLTVKELTSSSGLSTKYCSHLFQQMFGLTIKEYQIKMRIEYAHYLLEHTNLSVKEIAAQLDYPDPFTFSKQYKLVMGITPSQTSKIRLY